MRVRCSGVSGGNVEGEVIGGDHCDEVSGEVDMTETFTVRTDRGTIFSVHAWMVDVVVVDETELVM